MDHEIKSKYPKKISDYIIVNLIAKGGFGKIYKVINVINNKIYAMKKINCNNNNKVDHLKQEKWLKNELKILYNNKSKYLICAYDTFKSKKMINDEKIYIILDYCNGPTL